MIEKIKSKLVEQKKTKTKGDLYYYTQINFSYNSNRIEGSLLTEKETEAIYNTISIYDVKNDTNDIIETKNHFKLFDYILDNYDKQLTKNMMIKMHQILKRNTIYELEGFKKFDNVIGNFDVIETTKKELVEDELDKLLEKYNSLSKTTIEDIIDFHYNFEIIHPFSDGNGRIGRIIMFKECLKNNIIPFIISDEVKNYYLRGLKEYKRDKMYLIDTCKNAQDLYEKICYLMIDNN